MRSLPASPNTWSSPVPPVRVSLPAPPNSRADLGLSRKSRFNSIRNRTPPRRFYLLGEEMQREANNADAKIISATSRG